MLRALLGLIRKEFRQVFRDHNMIRLIFMVPVIQLMLFGYVVNLDVKKIGLDVYDFNQTRLSRQFINSAGAGNYFSPIPAPEPILGLEKRFIEESSDMAVIIPPDFDQKIDQGESVTIGLITDASNANQASIGAGYMARITRNFSEREYGFKPPLEVRYSVLYNPEMESVYYMVPGIVATLLTMITVMLTSMGVVREREQGTLEQLMVTPISRMTFLAGKLIPFAMLGILEMIIALTLGVVWFHIPFVGSSVLLFSLAGLYLGTTLGIGLLISTLTSTQQQAMFFAWFVFVFALLTSGFFTPIRNMPEWMQYITLLNPMRYFMSIVRAIMMKGAGISEIAKDIYPLLIYPVVVFTIAVMRFSKRTD